ncbi:MAG: hypothetical protein ABS46_12035 [Cytophagaceae bacterium SCN 52-12]|nr:MAG: hypothetical protein ABS46_12035 [Cytophagaceae bacterium SCN 52-12]
MDFIREDDSENGVIKALDGEIQVGELTYTWSGSKRIIIDHTEVYQPYEGRGIGTGLVGAAMEFARENDIRILPLCSFARKVIENDMNARALLFVPGTTPP